MRRTWCAPGTLWALGALGALGTFGMTACAGQSAPAGTQAGVFALAAAVDAIKLSPGDTNTASFLVTSRGAPAPGQTVAFAIVQGPGAGAQGATLAATSGVSDASGTATVGVRAGLSGPAGLGTTFQVQATLGTASAEIAVIVETGTAGSVLVAPFFAPSSTAAATATGLTVRFYDQTSCGDINLAHPPAPARDVANLAPGGTALYDFVNTGTVSAAVGQALSITGTATTVLAQGCIDIPGSSLLADSTVEVALPLYDATPDPVGTFAVTSTLSFQPPLAAAAALAAPWADLQRLPARSRAALARLHDRRALRIERQRSARLLAVDLPRRRGRARRRADSPARPSAAG